MRQSSNCLVQNPLLMNSAFLTSWIGAQLLQYVILFVGPVGGATQDSVI